MRGQWHFQEQRETWCLHVDGRVAITVATAVLDELCSRYGISRRDALAWIATRPKGPYRSAA